MSCYICLLLLLKWTSNSGQSKQKHKTTSPSGIYQIKDIRLKNFPWLHTTTIHVISSVTGKRKHPTNDRVVTLLSTRRRHISHQINAKTPKSIYATLQRCKTQRTTTSSRPPPYLYEYYDITWLHNGDRVSRVPALKFKSLSAECT